MRDLIPLTFGLVTCAFLTIIGLSSNKKKNDRLKAEQPEPPPPLKPEELKCGCGHNLALHDVKEGKCYAQLRMSPFIPGLTLGDLKLISAGGIQHSAQEVWVQCPCRQYTGPDHPTIYLSFKDMS